MHCGESMAAGSASTRRRARGPLLRDLRLAARNLAKRPGFAAAAVLTLAVGLGANTAVFSVVRGVLLQPLPFPEPERLASSPARATCPSPTAWTGAGNAAPSSPSRSSCGAGPSTSPGTATPSACAGRWWSPNTSTCCAPRLSSGACSPPTTIGWAAPGWRCSARASGSAASGATPRCSAGRSPCPTSPRRSSGVMPARFDFLANEVDLWVPVAVETPWAMAERGTNNFDAIGRLRPGVAFASARDEMVALTTRLGEVYPSTNARKIVEPLPMLEFMTARVQRSLLVLLGAVSLLVLLATVNLSGLLLARVTRTAGRIRGAPRPGRGHLAHPPAGGGRRPRSRPPGRGARGSCSRCGRRTSSCSRPPRPCPGPRTSRWICPLPSSPSA